MGLLSFRGGICHWPSQVLEREQAVLSFTLPHGASVQHRMANNPRVFSGCYLVVLRFFLYLTQEL